VIFACGQRPQGARSSGRGKCRDSVSLAKVRVSAVCFGLKDTADTPKRKTQNRFRFGFDYLILSGACGQRQNPDYRKKKKKKFQRVFFCTTGPQFAGENQIIEPEHVSLLRF